LITERTRAGVKAAQLVETNALWKAAVDQLSFSKPLKRAIAMIGEENTNRRSPIPSILHKLSKSLKYHAGFAHLNCPLPRPAYPYLGSKWSLG
jgi:hypothetical protein